MKYLIVFTIVLFSFPSFSQDVSLSEVKGNFQSYSSLIVDSYSTDNVEVNSKHALVIDLSIFSVNPYVNAFDLFNSLVTSMDGISSVELLDENRYILLVNPKTVNKEDFILDFVSITGLRI